MSVVFDFAAHPWLQGAPVRTNQIHLAPGRIDLGIGQPGFDLLPVDLLRRAADHRLAQGNPYLLNYGYEQGDGYTRLALAEFLTQQYGTPVDPDHLFLTAGASQGLDLICTLFSQAGDVIFVEEPSYFLALRIFADHRLRVVSLPTDADGLDLDALEAALTQQRPAFLYTIPTFQNPAGVTLSAPRRARLAQIAAAHDLLIIADEVYHLLAYSAAPPPPLALSAGQAPVLALGSFSKILAPGLRVGWVQGSPGLIQKLTLCGLADSGGGLNHFTAAIVRSVLELGWLDPYFDQLKAIYGARADVLAAALRRDLPQAQFDPAQGGFFLWLRLPSEVDTEALLPAAHRHGVGYQPGVRFSSREGLGNYLRLSFAFFGAAELREGAARLAETISEERMKAKG